MFEFSNVPGAFSNFNQFKPNLSTIIGSSNNHHFNVDELIVNRYLLIINR